MRGPKALFEAENNLVTEMGAWFPGERVVFRGKDLHHDLAGLSWMELYLFGITGRRFDKTVTNVLETMWVLTSFPDPRLWNNRVSALAGSARSTPNLGFSAAVAVSEARIYGRGLDVEAIEFLIQTRKRVQDGEDLHSVVLEWFHRYRRVPGFGRPITRNDERLESLKQLLVSKGVGNGAYTRLVNEVEKVSGRYRLTANYGAVCAAFCADIGLSTREYYMLSIPAFVGGMLPSCMAAAQMNEAAFFPLRCAVIDCRAPGLRTWGDSS